MCNMQIGFILSKDVLDTCYKKVVVILSYEELNVSLWNKRCIVMIFRAKAQSICCS